MKIEILLSFALKKKSVKNIETYVHGFNRNERVFCLYNKG